MLTEYIAAAMKRARYEIMPDGSFYADILGLDGVYAKSPHLEACLKELQDVLEEWIILGIARHTALPVIDGLEIKVKEGA